MNERNLAIEVKNVVKSYGALRAVDDVSLEIGRGVFITLLGPSGCGKTTLLRSIGGFSTPDSGAICVDGRDVTAMTPHERPVNMVFQDYALFPHMTVKHNIGFGCEMQGKEKSFIDRRVATLLDLIRMPELGGRYPEELSGGQRQRVALARALAPDPVSLLLDEPLAALDLKLRQEMQHELKTIQRQTGKTFVFVTHDQDEAMSMSDLVAVMKDGRIEQLDTPQKVYTQPASAFVAGFVGAANMLPAFLESRNGPMLEIRYGNQVWHLPDTQITSRHRPEPGQPVTLVIRPEDLTVSPKPEAEDIVIRGRLNDRTFLGGHVHLHMDGPDGVPLLVDVRAGALPELADELYVSCRQQAVSILAHEE